MLGTRRPARVHERIVNALLHVVNDPLLEVLRSGELADAGDRLVDDGLVVRSCRLAEIETQQPAHAICFGL
jgi:hypothetical protein